jgi:tetratricopeptide (TPR) repeat protein
MEQAIAAAQKELKINPFGETSWFNLALVYYYGDRPADAEAAINRDLELSPADEISMSLAAHILLDGSKPEAALDIAQKIQKSTRERLALLPFIYDSLNRASDAESALHALIEHFGADNEADVVAAFYAHRGNADSAFSWLERAHARRVSGLLNFIRDPLFRNIRSDPRFSVFMRKLGLID